MALFGVTSLTQVHPYGLPGALLLSAARPGFVTRGCGGKGEATYLNSKKSIATL